ncbi:hypothetical protein BGZ49_008012 [Haplosporangium sp. Z 27]|nr:hypothetical protein BGZ49_008012 [Haplosporangium sp. Z 27]
MPSFLRRFSTRKGSNSTLSQPSSKSPQQQWQQDTSSDYRDNNKINVENVCYESQELVESSSPTSNESSTSGSSSGSRTPSENTTISSSSSLSLYMTDNPSPGSTLKFSKTHHQTRTSQQQQNQSTAQNFGSRSSISPDYALAQMQEGIQIHPLDARRSSVPSLSALFQPGPRSTTMITGSTATHSPREHSAILSPVSTSHSSPNSKRASVDNLSSNPRRRSENFSSGEFDAERGMASPTTKGKKIRPKSLSSLLLQHEQQIGVQPKPSYQPKSSRWASKNGIGSKEMMVDLETTGVFVPSNGQRLRVEFVYRTIIQCADEIRSRGLDHISIFSNPSPKKVISSMIALMMDQERCDLYSIQFLRIDTVAGLMLNLLSQMSNPVIPYLIMDHYFKLGSSSSKSPALAASPISISNPNSMSPLVGPERSSSPISSLMPTIPALPPRGTSQSTISWAREYFDLPSFLDVLPSINRVILLEVLHLCRDLLEHQVNNRVSFHRLVEQIAPALFSTVFDQKILETMAGSRRCSIHGDTISPEDGSRAEKHLFSVILARFLYLTSYPPSAPNDSTSSQKIYNHSNNSMFRKSQEDEHRRYHERMALSYEEMELQQEPLQHFGVYSESQKQQQQQQLLRLKQKEIEIVNRSQEQIVSHLAMSMSVQAV